MRNTLKNLAVLMFVYVIGIMFIDSANAQDKYNYLNIKPPNYEYLAGEKVGFSLLKKCSAFVGTITEINGSQITFSIKEKLLENKSDESKSTIELNYTKPSPTTGSADYPQWAFVDVEKGGELIVFHCENKNETGENPYITSDQKLFSSIRKSILHYSNFKQNPETLLEVPNLVRISNDLTFLGYLVEFISKGGAIEYADYTVLVLTQLMESDKIPQDRMGFTKLQLQALLAGDFVFPIKTETRDTALRNLIRLGSSNKKLAGQAVVILANIADDGRVDLRPYLHPQNKIQLYENLQTLSKEKLSQNKREKFERLLMSK